MGEADRFFENKKERMMSVCLIGGNPNKTFKYAKLDISIQMKRYITDLKILHFQIQTESIFEIMFNISQFQNNLLTPLSDPPRVRANVYIFCGTCIVT